MIKVTKPFLSVFEESATGLPIHGSLVNESRT
jgi:hypothetical protein